AAPEELAQLAFEPLIDVLRVGQWGTRDASMAHDAAVDAIMELLRSPRTYAPAQSSLWSFLEMAGRRNLANLRLSEQRRAGRVAWLRKNVALCPPARNKNKEGVLDQLVEREATEAFWCRVNGDVDSLSAAEAQVFRLMASGVRATLEYARVLGMVTAPPGEQRCTVNRVKDRLRKRMRRRLRSIIPCDG
ncbi:MAG: hypothetical protein ACYCUV_09400, partial [Phycisphaerae bacterium]